MYFVWEVDAAKIPNTGCSTIKMNATCDNTLFENVLLQIKYSMSCIDIHDCINRKLKISNLLFTYEKIQANNPNIYVFNETVAFQHIWIYVCIQWMLYN